MQTYAQYYTLDLFSNFTFFLNDPVNGDGIKQSDRRWVAGTDARWERRAVVRGIPFTMTTGMQYRLDTPRVLLAHQADRHVLARTQDVNVVEQSVSPFLKLEAAPWSWLRVVTGARGDVFHYQVSDNLHGEGGRLTGNATRAPSSSTRP